MSDIPLIDLSQQFENSDAEIRIAEQIDLACRRSGFFAVRGHGMPETVIENCWQVSRQYFCTFGGGKTQGQDAFFRVSLRFCSNGR